MQVILEGKLVDKFRCADISCQCGTGSAAASYSLVLLTQVQIVALLLWSFIALMTLDVGWNTIRFNLCPVDLHRPSYVLSPFSCRPVRGSVLIRCQQRAMRVQSNCGWSVYCPM